MDKPQGYKRTSVVTSVCNTLGISKYSQTESTAVTYKPVWNKCNELVGYQCVQTGSFLDVRSLPLSDITGEPILPPLADVPFLYAEHGALRSVKVKRGKFVQAKFVRTSERPKAKYRTIDVVPNNIPVYDFLPEGNINTTAGVRKGRPVKTTPLRANRSTLNDDSTTLCETRSSRRFRNN